MYISNEIKRYLSKGQRSKFKCCLASPGRRGCNRTFVDIPGCEETIENWDFGHHSRWDKSGHPGISRDVNTLLAMTFRLWYQKHSPIHQQTKGSLRSEHKSELRTRTPPQQTLRDSDRLQQTDVTDVPLSHMCR